MRARIGTLAVVVGVLALFVSTAHADSWILANTPGFGNPDNKTGNMAIFDGHLYVVTTNRASGSEVWKTRLGSGRWREVTPSWGVTPAPIGTAPPRALALAVFENRLYIGADNGDVWRTAGQVPFRSCVPFRSVCLPVTAFVELWSEVTPTAKNWRRAAITSLAAFDGRLHLATSAPLEIWRTPDGATWEPVVSDGFGDAVNNHSGVLGTFAGQLYVGSSRERPGGDGPELTGLEIWRTGDGVNWEPVVASDEDGDALPGALLPGGFGYPGNATATALVVFRGRLYVSTVNHPDRAQVWRFNGLDWEDVTPAELQDPFSSVVRLQTMAVFRSRLFLGRGIGGDEATVWATLTGAEWGVVNAAGFGEGLNTSIDDMAASWPYFFVATDDDDSGVRIWRKAVTPLDVRPLDPGRCRLLPALCEGPPPIPTD